MRLRTRRRSWALAIGGGLAFGVMLLCAEAGAQRAKAPAKAPAKAADEAAADDKPKDAEPKVEVERRGGKKVFRITTTFVIEGRIQKPNAFYVLQRSQINYDWAQLKQDFVPRIVHSVSRSPF